MYQLATQSLYSRPGLVGIELAQLAIKVANNKGVPLERVAHVCLLDGTVKEVAGSVRLDPGSQLLGQRARVLELLGDKTQRAEFCGNI